jgi:hypothetical protein
LEGQRTDWIPVEKWGGYKITTVVIRYYRNLSHYNAKIMWDESSEEHTLITSTAASTSYFKFLNTENVEFILT